MQPRRVTALCLLALGIWAHPGVSQETLPTPYTAEQIRDAFPLGLEIVTRTWNAEQESLSRMTVESWSAEAATISDQPVDSAGAPTGEKSFAEARWTDLRDHATFPAASASRARHVAETELGRLEGWLYRVEADGDSTTSMFFADLYPGPPVVFASRVAGELVFRAEQIRRLVPAG